MTEIIKLETKWFIGEQLGSGGFGHIHLGQSEAGKEVVIKLVPKAPGADRELLFEDLSGVPSVVPILDRGEWSDYWVLFSNQCLNRRIEDEVSLKREIAALEIDAQHKLRRIYPSVSP